MKSINVALLPIIAYLLSVNMVDYNCYGETNDSLRFLPNIAKNVEIEKNDVTLLTFEASLPLKSLEIVGYYDRLLCSNKWHQGILNNSLDIHYMNKWFDYTEKGLNGQQYYVTKYVTEWHSKQTNQRIRLDISYRVKDRLDLRRLSARGLIMHKQNVMVFIIPDNNSSDNTIQDATSKLTTQPITNSSDTKESSNDELDDIHKAVSQHQYCLKNMLGLFPLGEISNINYDQDEDGSVKRYEYQVEGLPFKSIDVIRYYECKLANRGWQVLDYTVSQLFERIWWNYRYRGQNILEFIAGWSSPTANRNIIISIKYRIPIETDSSIVQLRRGLIQSIEIEYVCNELLMEHITNKFIAKSPRPRREKSDLELP